MTSKVSVLLMMFNGGLPLLVSAQSSSSSSAPSVSRVRFASSAGLASINEPPTYAKIPLEKSNDISFHYANYHDRTTDSSSTSLFLHNPTKLKFIQGQTGSNWQPNPIGGDPPGIIFDPTSPSSSPSSSQSSTSVPIPNALPLPTPSPLPTVSHPILASNMSTFGTVPSEFNAVIKLGTPQQELRVLFDTGSYLVWVRSVDCVGCFGNGARGFDGGASTSFNVNASVNSLDQFGIQYNDGTNVTGYLVTDTISAGGNSLVAQQGVSVGQFGYTIFADDGSGEITFGGFDTDQFADANATLQWSSITPGVPGKQNYSAYGSWALPTTSIQILQETQFDKSIQQDNITMAQSSTTSVTTATFKLPDDSASIVDTGTSFMVLPKSVVDEVLKGVKGAVFSDKYGVYLVDCGVRNVSKSSVVVKAQGTQDLNNLNAVSTSASGQQRRQLASPTPVITTTITSSAISPPIIVINLADGSSLYVTVEEYVIKTPKSSGIDTCMLALSTTDDTMGTYVLGNTFLKRYYTVFDYDNNRIGFTLSKNRTVPSIIKSINNNPVPTATIIQTQLPTTTMIDLATSSLPVPQFVSEMAQPTDTGVPPPVPSFLGGAIVLPKAVGASA
ncbi:hypothetical protein HDU76_003869 [Blyttiomyces sp. JEL0837]|nr:hypothetical protein HDU76_003869 [Blyttiomyces sp. JEL0837]